MNQTAPSPMTIVDPNARDRVAAEVRQFLDGKTTAFEFDDAIFDIESNDPTVNEIVDCLWYHYDDCKDYLVTLSKPEWDCFQRLLLILESDRHVITECNRTHWGLTQLVALVALVGFALCVWQFGLGIQLLAIAIPFGVISMGISVWRHFSQPQPDNAAIALTPFSSFAELRATYTSVGKFRKTPYRHELTDASIRSPFMNTIIWIPNYMSWLMFSPFVLFFQMLPHRDYKTRVVAST